MAVLKNIPYVGAYMGTVLGIVWGLYNFGLKFKSVEAKGAAWAGTTVLATTTTPETTTVTPTTEAAPGSFL